MKKKPEIFLRHILECIAVIENHTRKTSQGKFSRDVKTQDAVIRRIEIIGEAVKNLPAEFTKRHTEIEWREMAGMRDKLIHEYFGIHLDVVWTTIMRDIPRLKRLITALLKRISKVIPP